MRRCDGLRLAWLVRAGRPCNVSTIACNPPETHMFGVFGVDSLSQHNLTLAAYEICRPRRSSIFPPPPRCFEELARMR